jgi:CRP/FNR family transcriptional regulator
LPCTLLTNERDVLGDALIDGCKILAGQDLYQQGHAFQFIHAVRSGALKSTVMLADGRKQICGFHMTGDVVALDGFASGTYATTMTALEDTQVCTIAHGPLLALIPKDPSLQRRLLRLMSNDIARGRRLLLLLGISSAHERLAAFLLDLSQRFSAQGYSAREFNLRMSRVEIASFLGLKHETVSRAFSDFHNKGLIQVDKRRVRITALESFSRRYEALLQVR